MSNQPEVYRGVNKYIDYTTTEEYFEYGDPSEKKSTATLRATLLRYPRGKRNALKRIGNTNNVRIQGGYQAGTRTYQQTEYRSYFEFVDTWVERAKDWERV